MALVSLKHEEEERNKERELTFMMVPRVYVGERVRREGMRAINSWGCRAKGGTLI